MNTSKIKSSPTSIKIEPKEDKNHKKVSIKSSYNYIIERKNDG